MDFKYIDSKDNKLFKLYKSLSNKKYRDKYKLFILEGKKLFIEALSSGNEINKIICNRQYIQEHDLTEFMDKVIVLSDSLFNILTEMENSEGIITVLEYIENKEISSSNIICLDNIQDPGNLGTIIRCANAFGIKDLICINCVDRYNSKVLRASMGAIFRTNIIKSNNDFLLELKNKGYKIISTTLNEKSKFLENTTFTGKNIIVMGNEANGVSNEILKISDEFLKIRIDNTMESLNVSIATSIIMHEIFREK